MQKTYHCPISCRDTRRKKHLCMLCRWKRVYRGKATITVYSIRPVSAHYVRDSTRYYKEGSLFLQGIDETAYTKAHGSIAIQKMNVFNAGDYAIGYVTNCPQTYTCDATFLYDSHVRNYFAETGRLTITKLDTLNKIVSGRFYFTARDTLGNKKEITNGVFDIKYD